VNIYTLDGFRVLDPHPFHADPVPGIEINEDPDPGLDFFPKNNVVRVKI